MAGHIGPASFTPFPAGAKQLTSIILHRIKAAASLFFRLFFFPRLRHSSGSSRPLSLEPLGRHANTITPGYLSPSTHTTDQIITLVPFFSFLFFFEIKFPALARGVVAHQYSLRTIICKTESVERSHFVQVRIIQERREEKKNTKQGTVIYISIRFVISCNNRHLYISTVQEEEQKESVAIHNTNSGVCACVCVCIHIEGDASFSRRGVLLIASLLLCSRGSRRSSSSTFLCIPSSSTT